MGKIENLENLNRPWVIAHRGYRGAFPENTFSAFEAAIKAKADMIELDVALTKDRVPVIIHDTTIDRTTEGEGLVSDFNLSELKELDAGSWFKKEFKGEKIPTLEETLGQIKGRISLNIEIKPESFESIQPHDAIEIQICKLLKKFEVEESVLISSFEHSFFSRIISYCQKNKNLNFLRIAPLEDFYKTQESILSICKREKAFSFHPNENFVTESLIHALKSSGYKIFPYTVNDKNRMRQLLQFGASGIITDEPGKMWELINSM